MNKTTKKLTKALLAIALITAMTIGFSAQTYACLDRTILDPRIVLGLKQDTITEDGVTYHTKTWKTMGGAKVIQVRVGDKKDLYEIEISADEKTVTSRVWYWQKILFFGWHGVTSKKIGKENVEDFFPVLTPFNFGDIMAGSDLEAQSIDVLLQTSPDVDANISRYKSKAAYFWIEITYDGKKVILASYGPLLEDGSVDGSKMHAGSCFDYNKLSASQKKNVNDYKNLIFFSNNYYNYAKNAKISDLDMAFMGSMFDSLGRNNPMGALGIYVGLGARWGIDYAKDMLKSKEYYDSAKDLYQKILAYDGIGI